MSGSASNHAEPRSNTEESARQQADREAHADVINELAACHDPISTLVNSIAQNHYGDDHIKKGLILQLVRGTSSDETGTSHRGLIHRSNSATPEPGRPTSARR